MVDACTVVGHPVEHPCGLEESLRVAAGAYGPGAWGRLAAARLEQLSTEWRGVAEYSCRAQAQGFKTDFLECNMVACARTS